jgi:flavin reductase (DIM6/NTAB) family NADH-FMN oxidoreductase RutF
MLTPLEGLDGPSVYHLLTQAILPRPIAWVVSDSGEDADERWNLAPFSYFNGVASDPPLVMFSVGNGMAGRMKDTLANVTARPIHTIALPHLGQLDAVQASAEPLPHGRSEFAHAGLEPVDWGWPAPRPGGCRIALGCTLERTIDIVPDDQFIVISRVQLLWVDDSAVTRDTKGRIRLDPVALDPLARLGAGQYSGLGPPERPTDGAGWSADERTTTAGG